MPCVNMATRCSKTACRHGTVFLRRWLAFALLVSSPTLQHVAFCGMLTRPVLRRSRSSAPSRLSRHAETIESGRTALEVLGLPASATQTEIRTRYRTLAAVEHPDKNPDDPQAPTKFAKIVAAYQYLTELEKQPRVQFPSAADVEDVKVPIWWQTFQRGSRTVNIAATGLIILALLSIPLGFWAREEMVAKCTTAAYDKQWCDQLAQFRCAGEVFLGERAACLVDAQKFMAGSIAGSSEDYIADGALLD
eukprot:TRINITY_DN1178_c0_g1_i1.p1 TRINITY_DN1178_c0_g1~~TRINITY_DN1178_c0_g1_i1.p1  ORF type:complete len:249 (-),score=11.52 TRINITY_DN1178_c0_g1_i1:410-1156(-)